MIILNQRKNIQVLKKKENKVVTATTLVKIKLWINKNNGGSLVTIIEKIVECFKIGLSLFVVIIIFSE